MKKHTWYFFLAYFVFNAGEYTYIEGNFWISILLDIGNRIEINVLTSNFILLGTQLLFELAWYPEIFFLQQIKSMKHVFCLYS